jgi:hypothetical protein
MPQPDRFGGPWGAALSPSSWFHRGVPAIGGQLRNRFLAGGFSNFSGPRPVSLGLPGDFDWLAIVLMAAILGKILPVHIGPTAGGSRPMKRSR